MLAQARGRGVYDECLEMALGDPLDFPADRFAMVMALGVFTAGHAGPEALDELIRVARPGGFLLFSLSEAVYEPGGFKKRLEDLQGQGRIAPLDSSAWTCVFTDFPGETPPRHRISVYRVV
jgi:SAM-dependent methyltransferase